MHELDCNQYVVVLYIPLSLQLLKDWHLMVIVLILVMVDLIILTTVTAVESSRYTVISVRDRENAPSVNVSQKKHKTCESTKC